MKQAVIKIISGGQNGADRAGLDFAIENGIEHGGWCPKGRRSEDGVIPAQYKLVETPSREFSQRTDWNVRDSDGTVVISLRSVLSRGSKRTVKIAAKLGKPLLHIAKERDGGKASELLRKFIQQHAIKVLNVAGPRASKEPEVGEFVKTILEGNF